MKPILTAALFFFTIGLLQISEAQDFYFEKNERSSHEALKVRTDKIIKRLQHKSDTIFHCSMFDEFVFLWFHKNNQCIEYNVFQHRIEKKIHDDVWPIYITDTIRKQYFTYKWMNDAYEEPCFPHEILGGNSIEIYIKGEKKPLFCSMVLDCIYSTEYRDKCLGAYIQQMFRDVFRITVSSPVHQ